MATVEECIQLANQITEGIVQGLISGAQSKQVRDLIKTSRNEWMKWLQVVQRQGLDNSIGYARQVSQDVTVRQNVRTIYEVFADNLHRTKGRLAQFGPEERRLILGYVAWLLRISAESQGSQESEDSRERFRRQERSPRRRR